MLSLYFDLYIQYNPSKNSRRIILLETEKVNLNFTRKQSVRTILENLQSRPDTQICKVGIMKAGEYQRRIDTQTRVTTENPKADHAYMDMGFKTKVLMH